jgi:hypothetical protein
VRDKPELIFGQFGLSKVKYSGAQKGRYKGPETCHWYEVEAEKVLYIDNRDRVRMLGLKDAFDRHIFEGL